MAIGNRHLVCLIFLFLLAVGTNAQYRFDSWTTDSGLPHNTVKAILQTRDGYLWLASLDGLVRYDGVRFTVFNTGNTPGLKSNRLTSLFEDQSGQLWIGTEDSGLVKYLDGVFTTFTTEQGLPGNLVRGIWADARGMLILTGNRGLFRWQNEKAEPYELPAGTQLTNVGDNQESGMLWYCDQTGLHVVVEGNSSYLDLQSDATDREVIAVHRDRQGAFWVGTRRLGLWRFKDGQSTNFTTKDGLPENSARTIVEDREGTLWFGSGASGLVSYRNGLFTTYTTTNGLSDNALTVIYEDHEDNLWVGTVGGGLNRLGKAVVSMYSDQNGLPANGVYPILEDRSGAIWLGVWPKGLARYAEGKFSLMRKDDRVPGKNLTALAEDHDGAIWIGAYDGVSRYKDGQFTDFKHRLDGPGFHYVAAILVDRDGAIWFGANTGLYRLKDDAVTQFTTRDGLAGNEVKAILQDANGTLWVGGSGGVTHYEDGRWRTFTSRDGLASDKVRSLYQDKEGVIWIGTYDGGLTRLKHDKVTSITQKDGLYNNGVFQTLEDDRGNFWLSSNLGIYRVSKQQLNDFADGKVKLVSSVPYTRRDGLTNIECNGGTQPAGIKTRDGRLWFPTQGGAAVVEANKIAVNPKPPPVVIEGFLVDRNPVDSRQGVTIYPDQESVEISYTGLSFIKPEQIRFKYKMTGLDGDWIDVGARRTAYYSHLPPGTYQFTVVAANSDGVWNSEGQSVLITVVAPFWKRWWFLGLVVGALVLLAFAIYKRRISQLYRARAAQETFSRQLIESQETERKRIAGELHDSIGQNLLIIKNRALLGLTTNASQAVSVEQLNEISATASQAIEEVREIAGNLRPYKLDRLGLTKALESIVDQARNASEINFSAQIDPINDRFSKEAEINLFRIVQESINNILKHSKATEVQVVITSEENSVRLEIRDNGVGFEAESATSNGAVQRGFGLAGIAERVRIIGGKYSIRSAPGQGTLLSIRIEIEGEESKRA